jgi:hypothetical protein
MDPIARGFIEIIPTPFVVMGCPGSRLTNSNDAGS